MTSAFTQPTGPTAYPLQPTADGPQVPRGLDVDGPGHTPIPQNAHGYAPNTQHDSLNPSAAGGNYTSVSNPNSGLNEPREGFTEHREGYKPQEGFGERREGYDQPREGFGERHQGLNEPREHIGQQHYKNPLASHAPVTGTGTGTVGTGENFIGIPTTTFDVKAQDPKTIIVSGGGVSYTMATTYENKREVVTIRRTGGNQSHSTTGAGYGPQSTTTGPNLGQHTTAGTHYGTQVPPSGAHLGDHTAIEAHHTSQPTTAGANYGSQVPTGGAYVGDHTAVGAHHDPQSTATGTNYGANLPPSQAGLGSTEPALMTEMHDDQEPVVAQVEPHQLRSTKISFKGGPQIKLKDWLSGRGTPIHTFAEGDQRFEWRKSFKGMHHQLELFTLDQPDNRIAWAEKISTTEETLKEHEAGRPPLPAHPGTARLTLTEQALPLMDTVVVSFLLVDRESRNDPLHA